MKIYDHTNSGGQIISFEVASFIGRRHAMRIVERIPGVRIFKRPARVSWRREEEFCEFDIEETRFFIIEPFGDNSRFLVAPRSGTWVPQILTVREAFRRARWNVLAEVLLSLRRG